MLQSILDFIFAWYNLPFTILLAICVMLGVLQWFGLGGGDHESDSDVDHSVDHDLDHDFDHGLDHSLDHDLDHSLDHDLDHSLDHAVDHTVDHDVDHGGPGDHDAGAHADHGAEPGLALLAYLGLGRAPLMVILLLLFGAVGLLGWVFNALVLRILGIYPGLIFGASFVVSLGAGSYISSRLARVIGRALPPISTTATSEQALVGRRGTVISPFIDQRYGMVHLRDSAGTLISVFAVSDEEPPIRRGEEVIFISYDTERRLYQAVRATP